MMMKIAIVGSRNLNHDIPDWCLPQGVTGIFSGAARGIDTSARRRARRKNIMCVDILPEYDLYGKGAPLKRNDLIIRSADRVLVFWDGKSPGSRYVMRECERLGKPCDIFLWVSDHFERRSA